MSIFNLDELTQQCLGVLIYGNAGSGKTHTLRGLLEQTHGSRHARVPGLQHIIFDSEGEFATLRTKFDYLLAASGEGGDIRLSVETARALCQKVMATGVSIILDISDLRPEARIEFVAAFVSELIETPPENRRHCLVAIDEVHRFAPQGGKVPPSRAAIADLVALGRKRGLIPVLATQRIAKADKDAIAEIPNKVVGRITLDVDVDRAADDLGLRAEDRQRLKQLQRGQFFVLGPILSDTVTLIEIGPNETAAPQIGIDTTPPPTPEAIRELLAMFADLPTESDETIDSLAAARRRIGQLKEQLALRPLETKTVEVERIVEVEKIVTVEVPVLTPDALLQMKLMTDSAAGTAKELMGIVATAKDLIARAEKNPVASLPQIGSKEEKPARMSKGVSESRASPIIGGTPPPPHPRSAAPLRKRELPDAQQRILDSIAEFAALGIAHVHRANAAVWADLSPRTGSYGTHLSDMKNAGLVDYPKPGFLSLTKAGQQQAQVFDTPRTTDQLLTCWTKRMSVGQAKMLRAVAAAYPKALSRAEIGKQTDLSEGTGSFGTALAQLKEFGLVTYPKAGLVMATSLLFPKKEGGTECPPGK